MTPETRTKLKLIREHLRLASIFLGHVKENLPAIERWQEINQYIIEIDLLIQARAINET